MHQNFNVIRVPLVAIDCATMGLRRYVGRECTHEASLEGQSRFTKREVMDLIDLFREDPRRALRQSENTAPLADQPKTA
jgi:hypothetical protein